LLCEQTLKLYMQLGLGVAGPRHPWCNRWFLGC
jgi:hypothetical protein